jgi:hypothetical protein
MWGLCRLASVEQDSDKLIAYTLRTAPELCYATT